jgi:hypothetical protein
MNSSTTPSPDTVASSPSSLTAKPAADVKPVAPKAVSAPRKPSSKTASKFVSKSAAKPAAKQVTKSATKTTPKTAPKTTTKAVTKPTTKPASKPASKALVKPIVKPIVKPAIKAAETASPAQPKTAVEQKAKKPKLVRDSFTFPKDEYQAIATLKQRALSLQHSTKKSEILRAGLKLMSSLNDKAFLAALTSVPALKTGRPAKS